MTPHRIGLFRLLGLLAIAALLAPAPPLLAAPAGPAIWVVTRTDDPPVSGCPDGNCSLRGAVIAANAIAGPSIIRLSYATTYTLSLPASGSDDATTGDLNLNNTITFDFASFCLFNCQAVIRGGPGWKDSILTIGDGAAVNLNLVAIEDGQTPYEGGGIMVSSGGVLTLTNSQVLSNSAGEGGGIYNAGTLALIGDTLAHNQAITFEGGGLVSTNVASGLNIANSTITANFAHAQGGGLAVFTAAAMTDTAISHNDSIADNGGGLYYYAPAGALLSLSGMTIVSNTALSGSSVGGGLAVSTGRAAVVDSTLGWNQAYCGGGLGMVSNTFVQVSDSTILSNAATYGGGVCGFLYSNPISLTNVTVSGNRAKDYGGGLSVAQAGLYNVTINNNLADSDGNGIGDGGGLAVGSPGPIILANSILAGNNLSGERPSDCFGDQPIQSLGYNLIGFTLGCNISGTTTGDITNVDPYLGPLAPNGGLTWTEALPSNSKALNAGNPAGCYDGAGARITSDQRGLPRWGRCDMGAFELQPTAVVFLPLTRR